ncbi:MAG: hypothetical protein IKN87_00180 [Bacilli bacterium]|nr:hypothetical protein [Bacilli bacterium]
MSNIEIISDDTEILKKEEERLERLKEIEKNNEFNPKYLDFYYNGFFIINDKKISIDKVNIIISDNDKYYLDIVDDIFPFPKDIKIKKIIKFKNTSMLEDFLKKYDEKIDKNILKFDKEILDFLKNIKWNGKYNSIAPETIYMKER